MARMVRDASLPGGRQAPSWLYAGEILKLSRCMQAICPELSGCGSTLPSGHLTRYRLEIYFSPSKVF
jgi:hypothetical protein